MVNWKVGDKILCKKDLILPLEYKDNVRLSKGKIYTIMSINKGLWVSSNSDVMIRIYDVSVYFYTNQEYRRLKLNRLMLSLE